MPSTFQPSASFANPPYNSAVSPSHISYTASREGSLCPTVDDAQQRSREAGVSVHEAKLYINSMGESPLPSPHMYPHPSGFSAAVQSNDKQAPINGAGAGSESPTSMRTNGQQEEVGEFLDMDDDDREEEEELAKSSKMKNKPHAAVEDFPMPPSHNIHIPSSPTQSLDPASLRTPTQANPQPKQQLLDVDNASIDAPESPIPATYLSPTKLTSSSGTSATFRALRLLPSDLETTRVAVFHSSIKPNDRGKEVLSFVIEVNPGSGKVPWKVEKLYSDVLGLDHRVRISVGKSLGKKMAVLPEGKIWRDHAPAKSDQRKVSEIRSSVIVLSQMCMRRLHSKCISNH